MKKIIGICLILLTFCVTAHDASAQKEYKFIGRQSATLTSDTLISVTPKATLTVYYLSATHAVKFNAVTTYAVPGDMQVFKIKATSANRAIAWVTNMNAVNDTITSGKTKTYLFMYTGSAYDLISSSGVD